MSDTRPVCKSPILLLLILLYSLSVLPPLCASSANKMSSSKAALSRALAAATKAGDTAAVLALLKRGASINPKGEGNAGNLTILDPTALQIAASRGDLAMCEVLIGKGANPNLASFLGGTPLMLASATGNISVVGLLLHAGAKVNAISEDPEEETALLYAVRHDKPDVVKLLLNNGARVNSSGVGVSPLMLASASNDSALVKLLLDAGAKTDDLNSSNGDDPLMYAVRNNRVDNVRLLISKGADINGEMRKDMFPALKSAKVIGGTKWETYLDVAEKHNFAEIVTILEDAKAKKTKDYEAKIDQDVDQDNARVQRLLPLEVTDDSIIGDAATLSRNLEGVIKNTKGKTLSYVEIDVNFYDADRNQVDSGYTNTTNLAVGDTWKFKIPVLRDDAKTYKIVDIKAH